MPLTSPYNFVPINTWVYCPKWDAYISQDIPYEDGEDGYIEVLFKNVSPLFTRNGARIEKDRDKIETESSYVIDADGNKRYFIPGTTIKGMLRGTLEIMAFGKMTEKEHYTNRWFGQRNVTNSGYREIVEDGVPGWLTKKEGHYNLALCIGYDRDQHKVPMSELRDKYRYESSKNIWETNCSLASEDRNGLKCPVYPEYNKAGRRFNIVCTGNMKKKKYEQLFPVEVEPAIRLSDKTVEAFMTVYENTPGFNDFVKALDNGERVPVFYLNSGEVDFPVIGLSKMFRIPCKLSMTDLICHEQKIVETSRLDLCEVMFGTVSNVEGGKSLKGRIQVGHAFAQRLVTTAELKQVEGIMGQPKASYYPLYIKQDKNPYKTYDTGNSLAGRKLYRIHNGSSTTELPPVNEENKNMKTLFYALPAGLTFKLRINFHNLKKVELGALLSALTLHETKGAYHNIGLAKGFGYGKIEVVDIQLHVQRYNDEPTAMTRQDYELAFEQEMDAYVAKHVEQGRKWRDTEQVVRLTNILREHDDKVVRLMVLGDRNTEGTYGYYKNERNFDKNHEISRLTESSIPIKSLEDPGKDFKISHAADYENIDRLVQDKKYNDALAALDTLIAQLRKSNIDYGAEDAKRVEIEELKAHHNETLINDSKFQQEAKRQQRLEAGLAALLDEKYETGAFKVTTVKLCLSKVQDWLKKKQAAQLTADEQEDLKRTLSRIALDPDKKEERDLKKFNGKPWNEVVKHLGEDVARELFDRFTQAQQEKKKNGQSDG